MSPPGQAPTFVSVLEEVIRAAGGLTKLAKATNVPVTTLRRWRSGDHPTDRLTDRVEQVDLWARRTMNGAYPPADWPAGLPGFIKVPRSSAGADPKPTEAEITPDPEVAAAPGLTDVPDLVTAPHVAPSGPIDQELTGSTPTEPVEAKPEPPSSELLTSGELEPRSSGRKRWMLIAAVLVLAVAIGAGAWTLTSRSATVPEGSETVLGARTIVVQNKVAFGPSSLLEDDSPSYLSSRPVARCANLPGCKLEGTDVESGDVLQVACQLQGELLTNADVSSPGVETNPNVAGSALWYGVIWRDGRRGFISEVYVGPTYRGGLGLPPC